MKMERKNHSGKSGNMMSLNKRIEVIRILTALSKLDLEQQALFNYATSNPEGLSSMDLAKKILHGEINVGV